MNYDALMQKLATADLPINRRLVHVMDKVKIAGLHRATAAMYGLPILDVKTASQTLGQQMLSTHYKFKKIAAGLGAMAPRKQASMLPMPSATNANPARTQALLGLLKQMQMPSENMAGRQLGGAMNRGRPGMFSGVGEAANTFSPKTIPELPAMGRLPTGP